MAQANRKNTNPTKHAKESRATKTPSARSVADPIYAAITNHRIAWIAFEQAVEVEQALEGKLWNAGHHIEREPKVPIGFGYFARNKDDIKKAVAGRFLRVIDGLEGEARKAAITAEKVYGPKMRKAFNEALKADEARLAKEWKDTGWGAVTEAREAASDATGKALSKLCRTQPQTPRGLTELFAHLREITERSWGAELDCDESCKLYETLEAAAKTMASKADADPPTAGKGG